MVYFERDRAKTVRQPLSGRRHEDGEERKGAAGKIG
jgi:hypothetical protein